jgi:hypothetical protein
LGLSLSHQLFDKIRFSHLLSSFVSSLQRNDDIAWKSDREKKFKMNDDVAAVIDNAALLNANFHVTRQSPNGFLLPKVTDEEFMVWMRTAGLPEFKKLHRRIVAAPATFNGGETGVIPAGSNITVIVDSSNCFSIAFFELLSPFFSETLFSCASQLSKSAPSMVKNGLF